MENNIDWSVKDPNIRLQISNEFRDILQVKTDENGTAYVTVGVNRPFSIIVSFLNDVGGARFNPKINGEPIVTYDYGKGAGEQPVECVFSVANKDIIDVFDGPYIDKEKVFIFKGEPLKVTVGYYLTDKVKLRDVPTGEGRQQYIPVVADYELTKELYPDWVTLELEVRAMEGYVSDPNVEAWQLL